MDTQQNLNIEAIDYRRLYMGLETDVKPLGTVINSYCTMVTLKIKGTTCCLYSVYTVVITSHGITSLALAGKKMLLAGAFWCYFKGK